MSAYRTSPAPIRARLLAGCAIAAAATATQAQAQRAFQAAPTNAIGATVSQNTGLDTVTVNSTQALIDWTPDAGTGTINILAAGDELRFRADNASTLPRYTVLNRINPADPNRAVRIDGIVNSQVETGYGVSDGSIWFYTPGGIILGSNARFDVGSLVLTTNAPQVGNFDTEGLFVGQDTTAVAGTVAFRGAADSKSFVTVEAGAKINATGSYVALVAPRVAQRGAVTVNGSAALIAAESADVTIPVSGNLFEIAVFSGSKVDSKNETTLEHSGSTENTDPTQDFASRRVYMIAVPKNDAITMLVSGKIGYEAASAVTAVSGNVYLYAETDAKIVGDNPQGGPGQSTNVVLSGLTANTGVFAGGTFVSLDATTASSSFGGSLGLNSGASSSITVANGFGVEIGTTLGGSATLGVAPSTVTVASGGSLKVANNLALSSVIGTDVGSDMSVTVDNGTLEVGGQLGIRSTAGSIGGPATGSTGGNTSLAIRNNGVVTVGDAVSIESRGIGIAGANGADGTGGASTLTIESGGKLTAGSINVESLGQGGNGATGGFGLGALASLTVDGGSVETGYGITVQSIGQGGGSDAVGGSSGAGKAGTARLSAISGGTVMATTVSVSAAGQAGSEFGYGAISGGAAFGGTVEIMGATGGIITAQSITGDASATGGSGERGGGSATGGDVTLSASSTSIRFDQLTVSALGQAGSSFSDKGGIGKGGTASIAFDTATAPGNSAISVDVSGQGGFAGTFGGSGTGGVISFAAIGTDLASEGDLTFVAKGVGDFGSFGGGIGKGGLIEIVASGGKVAGANVSADATGFGGQAFQSGDAGRGQGGVIKLTAMNGGLVQGVSTLRSDGRGGSAGGVADPGAGKGGTVVVRAEGGTIDVGDATLRLFADGVGGRADFEEVSDAVSRGGTIDIGVSGAGQLAFGGLEAQANGYFDDQPDGPVANHGGTGVGGTVKLAVSGGNLAGEAVSLNANGTGSVSARGGVGGNGYQGRTEFTVSGGSVALSNIFVSALAQGGEGIGQDGELGTKAGAGGAAGIGGSPFGAGAGAIVDLTGGSFETSSLTIDGGSIGGRGGEGLPFAEIPQPGSGGEAFGGIATFSSSGSASFAISSLAVRADGQGGSGGALFLGEGSFSDAIGGSGGGGTGGLASTTIGGSGAVSLFSSFSRASGFGGDGGNVCAFSCSFASGDGRGGDGGAGFGGSANVTINRALGDFPFFSATSEARGGEGGLGPRGGDGGDALAGNATIAVASGETFFGGLQILSDGRGGDGADGLGGDAGSGGSGAGFNATLTIGADAKVSSGQIQLASTGQGGRGGRGADDSSTAFDGGDGGDGTGGTAAITISGGTLDLPGGSETPPAGLIASGFAGDGGSGGDASEGTAGAGGDGGDAVGGAARIASTNGAANLFATSMIVDAVGGARGQAGSGVDGLTGASGAAQAGSILIDADQTGAPANRVLLGFASLSANASARFEELATGDAGDIAISAKGANPTGALSFDILEARARGSSPSNTAANGIAIIGEGTPIIVDNSVELDATGAIALGFIGDSGLRALGDVSLQSSDAVAISHAGQAAGGPAASLSGRSVSLNGRTGIAAAATSRIDATSGLALTSGVGSVAIGSGRIGRSLSIDAAGDVTIGSGARLIADRSVDIRSGDDIIVDAGALLRAANDPPAESGYGSTDPREQQTQLRLYAGAIETVFTPGNVASILLRGDVEAPTRTIQLEGGAIQADDLTTLSGGHLFARITIIPEGPAGNDFGQLSAPCLESNACLANVSVSGLVRVGELSFAPQNLRISGNLAGGDVQLVARETIRLGRVGAATTLAATDALSIEAQAGDVVTLGDVALSGGPGVTRILAGDDISAPGLAVTAPAGVELRAAGDIVLKSISAPAIRTVDSKGSPINASGVTAAGLIDIGAITTDGDLVLDGGNTVTLGAATARSLAVRSTGALTAGTLDASAGGIALRSDQGGITVDRFSAADTADLKAALGSISVADALAARGVNAAAKAVILNGSNGLKVLAANATAGDLTLTTGEGDLSAGDLFASGNVLLNFGGAISFGSISGTSLRATAAFGDVDGISASVSADATITAQNGAVSIGSLTVGSPAATSIAGSTGVTLTAVNAAGIVKLASSGGAISATGTAPVASFEATGKSVSLTGTAALTATADATGGGASLAALGGRLTASARATGDVTLTSAQDATLGQTQAGGALSVKAGGDIFAGAGLIGQSVLLETPGRLDAVDLTATGGQVRISGSQGVTVGVLAATDLITLTATNGNVSVADALGTIDSATGTSVSLASRRGLTVISATATGGDLSLTASGPLSFGQLSATRALVLGATGDVTGGSATGGTIAVTTPGLLKADNLVAAIGGLSVVADKGISLNTAIANGLVTLKAAQGAVKVASDIRSGQGLIIGAPSIDLTAQNGLNIVQAVTTAGDLKLTAAGGNLTAGTLASNGGITLTALAGRIDVTNDISASGPIQATARALSLTALNELIVAQAQATGGDIALASRNGALTIGQASAAGVLTATTPGLLTVTGPASGATVAFTSKDIAIGSGAQIGSKTLTTSLTLTNTGDRMFIGDVAGSGYRLDAAELARLGSKGDISLVSTPRDQVDQAFSLLDPAATNIVVGALTFDGAQLGTTGTLRIASPRSIGFTGNAQFKNFANGQTVTINALADISLAAEAGLVTLKDSSGALAGTLRLEANQVHAMSAATRSEVAGLTLNQAEQRLGTNDQVNNQGGYFQAGNIVVRIGRLLFVQNSGANGADLGLRRGLTANSLTIFAGEGATPQIVLNGQVNGATGADLRNTVTLNGSFDPASTVNGCVIGAVCGVVTEPPPPEPVFDPAPVLSSSRDQVRSEEEEDEKEEALQAAQTRPDPIIQFLDVPSSRFDPLIEEPVTGAGNEDFWEAPLTPSPGR